MELHRNDVRAIWIAFLVIPSQLAHSQVDASSTTLHRIDTYLAQQTAQGAFSGSVLIGLNGHIAFKKGYGIANEEWSDANTPATKFRIASLTKQFTGACTLLLQERGLLSVHDPISKYVPDLPAGWQPITLHQLLTHTSGIPNFTERPQAEGTLNRVGITPRLTLGVVASEPLDFAPGTKLHYSNTGYILLGMVIEKISGVSYADFLQKNIFTPLGMADSGYDTAAKILPQRASGYMRDENGHITNADFIDMNGPFAAGGIYSTVEDMYLWNEALATPGKLLSADSVRQMFAVYPETTAYGGQNYGYGVVLTHRFGKLLYYHGGGVLGFNSEIQRYPADRLCIVILDNLDPTEPWNIADHIASELFHQPPPAR
jgi:CubicO group peptidase (beta-lactamase class C family)